MKLRNDFSEKNRELYTWKYDCAWCGQNGWDCLHHILGRQSSSILNSAPLHNVGCHLGNGKLAIFAVRKQLLQKTFDFLRTLDYTLTTEDIAFINKHKQYYSQEVLQIII